MARWYKKDPDQGEQGMTRSRALGVFTAAALVAALLAPVSSAAQEPPVVPAAESGVKVKELVGLLAARNLTSFAVKDPERSGRFIALLLVPDVQLLVVAASYSRSTDIDYRIYHKDYMTAYMDLRSSVLSSDKVFFEDTFADGLVLQPANGAGDIVNLGTEPRTFDGAFADPRKRNDKRIPQAEYYKAFAEADQRYARLLGLLLEELKKAGTGVASPAGLR
jgi:hypothetical protein